ncbi:MAG: D-alanyl-D-alanine carboxypeptidase, partial [Clostridia bacterium]|nr:D-alanyl-D-alanine carboxypeptidase [Clostridia bacterium]
VKQGEILGKAYVKKDNQIVAQTNLIAKYDVEKSGFFDNLKEFITNW